MLLVHTLLFVLLLTRVQSPLPQNLALDEVPSAYQVGVDSLVFFPQGSYRGTDGNNEGGMRWHEGVVRRVYKVGGLRSISQLRRLDF